MQCIPVTLTKFVLLIVEITPFRSVVGFLLFLEKFKKIQFIYIFLLQRSMIGKSIKDFQA